MEKHCSGIKTRNTLAIFWQQLSSLYGSSLQCVRYSAFCPINLVCLVKILKAVTGLKLCWCWFVKCRTLISFAPLQLGKQSENKYISTNCSSLYIWLTLMQMMQPLIPEPTQPWYYDYCGNSLICFNSRMHQVGLRTSLLCCCYVERMLYVCLTGIRSRAKAEAATRRAEVSKAKCRE